MLGASVMVRRHHGDRLRPLAYTTILGKLILQEVAFTYIWQSGLLQQELSYSSKSIQSPLVESFIQPQSSITPANMAELTLHNSIREKMLRDEVAYTLSVKLVRSVELPMMAKTAGFDGILIDMEHSTFDLDTTSTFSPRRPATLHKPPS